MKKFERITSVITKRSRAQRSKTCLRPWLTLVLAILSLSILSLHTAAQRRVRAPKAPTPTEKAEPTPTPRPDLVPADPNIAGSLGPFCWLAIDQDNRDSLNLFVKVSNIGNASAPASTAAVAFDVHGNTQVSEKSVPAILQGSRQTLKFRVPYGCFDPATHYCSFIIAVDHRQQVVESSAGENNNKVGVRCASPNPKYEH